ncbi:hypothetical protein [Baaleninema simplex]|uniref:hypothetical protein n=1 Tax=Baaleninema simplex TaxID=2862350 RepID=UPI0003472652|nr:hypothetical protein [Baaleninema simplex]
MFDRLTPEQIQRLDRAAVLEFEGDESADALLRGLRDELGDDFDPAYDALQQGTRSMSTGGMRTARQWGAEVLEIPEELLQELSKESIEELQQLPRWAQDIFRQLNDSTKRRLLLECTWSATKAAICVDAARIEEYVRNLSSSDLENARRLTSLDEVITAIESAIEGLPNGLNFGLYPRKFRSGEILNLLERFEITDLDLERIREFVQETRGGRPLDRQKLYNLFTQYLSALIPAKVGEDLPEFIRLTEDLIGSAGRSIRGSAFENFLKLYVPQFGNLRRAKFKERGSLKNVNCDLFDSSSGTIWEFKYQSNPLAGESLTRYTKVIGQQDIKDSITAERANFLFATQQMAETNKDRLKALENHNVFYVEQPDPNQRVNLVELQ